MVTVKPGSMPVCTLGNVRVGPEPTLTSKPSRVCSYSARRGTVSLARTTSGHSTTHVKLPWKRAGMETVPPVPSTSKPPSLYFNRFPLSHSCQSTVPKLFLGVPDPSRTAMDPFPSQSPVHKPFYSYLNSKVPFPTLPMT